MLWRRQPLTRQGPLASSGWRCCVRAPAGHEPGTAMPLAVRRVTRSTVALLPPHVTGLWPWNLALEMAARWSASLDGNHAAPPVADARVGPGGLLPPVPSGAVAPRCAREASAWHLSPHASHLCRGLNRFRV